MGIEAKKSDKTYYDSHRRPELVLQTLDAYYFSFPSVEEGFKAYLAFIEANPRYKKALAADLKWIIFRKLVEAGYATGNDGKGGGYTLNLS